MSGIMAVAMNNNIRAATNPPKVWTGITTGLQFNLLNAPASGTTWTDDSGNGKNATLQGSPTYISTNGGGVRLNNINYTGNDYVSVPYNINSSTVTVEMVTSFNPTSFWSTIWGNEIYNTNAGYMAYVSSSTFMTFGKGSSTQIWSITASNSIRHWVWVINGTSFTIYLNGSILSTSQTISPSQTLFTTNDFYFGSRHTNAGTGATDKLNNSTVANQPVFYQLRVYNTAFSAANVTTNYAAVKSSVTGGYGLP